MHLSIKHHASCIIQYAMHHASCISCIMHHSYHRSILNILLSAGLLKPPAKAQKSVPVDKRAERLEPASLKYDPLRIFRERLSSMRDNSRLQPTVISSPPILKQSKMSSTNAPRKSVIMTGNKEYNYSVPVSNSFEILGN